MATFDQIRIGSARVDALERALAITIDLRAVYDAHDLPDPGLSFDTRITIAMRALGDVFTLADLRSVYQSLIPRADVDLEPSNFRRKLIESGAVVATGERRPTGPAGGRPAELFRAA